MKLYILEVSPQAKEDIAEILAYYLAQESIERYWKVYDSFDESFERIKKFPLSNSLWQDNPFPDHDIRIAVHRKTYRIYYEVAENKISILHIYHGKRNPDYNNIILLQE